jgi:hypothetical protein
MGFSPKKEEQDFVQISDVLLKKRKIMARPSAHQSTFVTFARLTALMKKIKN